MIGNNGDAIHVRGLYRTYRRDGRDVSAVKGIDLAVRPGQIVALLGPNGAGKTTTVRVCATLLAPTAGKVEISGFDVTRETRAARRSLGLVLGGDRGFYGRATALENLRYFADLALVTRRSRDARIEQLLDLVGLADRMKIRVETYSRGMRQRLHIARALLADPDVLLLDEPTMGLDPEAAVKVRHLISELASGGKAILLTTHYLYEAQELADEVDVLSDGRILVRGDVATVAQAAGAGWVTSLTVDAAPQKAFDAVRGLDGVVGVEIDGKERTSVTVLWRDENADSESVISAMSSWNPRAATSRPATLEEAYLALLARVRNNTQGPSASWQSVGTQ